MRIFCKSSYNRSFKKLSLAQQAQVSKAISKLLSSFGHPHLHTGVGIRPFGRFFECRAGLELRVLFIFDGVDIILEAVGDHNEIARFVKNR